MQILEGKVALVTGAGSGIGRAITLKFLKSGASVAGADLYEDRLVSLSQEVASIGIPASRFLTAPGDVSNYDVAGAFVAKASDKFSKIDILVNNAGGSAGFGGVNFIDTEKRGWDVTINANLYTTLNCTKHALPHMVKMKQGRIVNIASTTGMGDSWDDGSLLAVYGACKAGIIGFTKAVSREVARYRINVNSISPGIIRTRVVERLPKEFLDESVSRTPLGRMGEPEDVANAALFLVSPESEFLTGVNLVVAGGLVMH